MSKVERIKFQGMIPEGKKREIEVQWNKGLDPTLQTWNDVVDLAAELVLEYLAAQNASKRGKHAAQVYKLKRMKDSEEALARAEFEIKGYVPREFESDESKSGTVTPIRKVEEA